MTNKQFIAEIKYSFFNEDINTTLKKVDDYFGDLNSFQKKRLIPLAALNYAIKFKVNMGVIINEQKMDYEKEIVERLECVLEGLLEEKKKSKQENVQKILSKIEEIKSCFTFKENVAYLKVIFLSKEIYSYYEHQLQEYGKKGLRLMKKEIVNYPDFVLQSNLNRYRVLSILTKIKREKETIHLGRMEKVDKPKLYNLLSKDKLSKVLNKLINKKKKNDMC